MNELPQSEESRVIRIGPDRVTIKQDEVIIEAKREMPDWKVREFQVIPIFFEENKYYLAQKTKAEKPFVMRYVLRPWVNGQFDAAQMSHGYDAEAVAERDADCKGEQRAEVAYTFLLPFYPLIGFLWSGAQNRLVPLGFIPRTITSVSVFVSFSLAFLELMFAVIAINGSIRSGQLMIGGMLKMLLPWNNINLGFTSIPIGWLDALIFVTLAVDSAMRFTYASRDDQWHGGLLEWVFRKKLRASF